MRLTFNVVGTQFDGRMAILSEIYDKVWTENKPIAVKLVAEPSNPYDSNAVAVMLTKPISAQIGYVPAEACKRVGQYLKLKKITKVKISDMGAGNRGIWVEIAITVQMEED